MINVDKNVMKKKIRLDSAMEYRHPLFPLKQRKNSVNFYTKLNKMHRKKEYVGEIIKTQCQISIM